MKFTREELWEMRIAIQIRLHDEKDRLRDCEADENAERRNACANGVKRNIAALESAYRKVCDEHARVANRN